MQDQSADVTIREMALEDLAAVYALGERVFTADRWPSLYRTWDEYEPVGLFNSDGEFCLVADRDEQLAGFALGAHIVKRKSAWSYGYLIWLAVEPEFGRSGIASALIAELTERFIGAGARIMIADTDAENEGAIGLFRSHGFLNEDRHVYLSKNLTTHPDYKRLRRNR